MPVAAIFEGLELRLVPEEHWAAAGNGTSFADAPKVPEGYPDSMRPDFTTGTFVPDLASYKLKKISLIKAARSEVESGGCLTPAGRADTDLEARVRISGAVQTALIAKLAGEPFEVAWTMEDNNSTILDADGMIAFGVSVATHVAGAFETATSLRAQVYAATTIEEVDAIVW